MTRFYLVKDRKRQGPFTIEELASSGVERTSLVWRQGMTTWMRADLLPELAELIVTLPPPIPGRGDGDEPNAGFPVPLPATLQTLSIWFTFLLVSGMVSVVVALVGLWIQLDAKSQILGGSMWHAYWTLNYFYDPAVHMHLVQTASTGAAMFWIGMGVAGLEFIPSVVLLCVLLHKSWSLVQDGKAPTTPGMAVGLLFVPLFNLYWVFVALYGLAWELNRVAAGSALAVRVSTGLALACCILLVCLAIPCVSVLALIPATILLNLLVHSIKRASMDVARTRANS